LKCWTHVFAGPVLAHVPADVETTPRPLTPRVSVPGAAPPVKVAETALAALRTTVQVVAVPVQAPPQPANFAPEAGVSARTTELPTGTLVEQAAAPFPQVIPPPVTRPGPVTDTPSSAVVGVACPPVKVADTDSELVKVTVQVVTVPEQLPPQPAKVAPGPGLATRVEVEPCV
jgi:hypothetical protein